SGQEKATAIGHQQLVAHHGQIRSTSDTRSHNRCDLWDTARRHDCIVVEDASEIVCIGEDILLKGEEDTGGIYQIYGWYVVLQSYLLGTQHFFGGHGKERSGLHCGVVSNHHEVAPAHSANATDDACCRCAAPLGVHLERSIGTKFQKIRVWINELC